MAVEITLFTDPACPFAFSAEPVRWRLRWHYGEGLRWRLRMIVLTREPGEAEKLAQGAPNLQRIYGMPIDPRPHARPASSEPACRLVVGARLYRPELEEPLLRRLRVRLMAGEGLLDEPALLGAAAADVGLDADDVEAWLDDAAVASALEDDAAAARSPAPAAHALDHKLGGPRDERRYTAPSYELRRDDGGPAMVVPGFTPVEALEAVIANLAPELPRRGAAANPRMVLRWAGEPLATAEVALIRAIDRDTARVELERVAVALPAGADAYWTLP